MDYKRVLHKSEAIYRAVVEQAEEAVLLTDLDGRVLSANGSAERLFGYAEAELLGLKACDFMLEQEKVEKAKANMRKSGENCVELLLRRKSGEILPIEVSCSLIEYYGHRVRLVIIRDITWRKQVVEELFFATKVIENAGGAIIITDAMGTILTTNQAFTNLMGYEKEEVIGKRAAILKSDRHTHAFYQNMWDCILSKGIWQGEVWDRKKNGEIFPVWLTINAVAVNDSGGDVRHFVGLFNDISKFKESQQQVEYLANHDGLTDLPNRNFFDARLNHVIARASREKTTFALVFLDLDDFKEVNDTFGHEKGDLLLKEVAIRPAHFRILVASLSEFSFYFQRASPCK
ncbi:PAS domain S-box protein [Ferrovum myxofaciens]|uniref:PAS domain S-box protein n=1 Tax=Ferrovum myxofaciens TaxID=416213 RepID=UPI002354E41A|nr:PAS domain S-box protein [Ferrovum myxofaciens]MBU6995881.1 PAS domain S-box protein [Ferrovum myxofaciens]